MTSYIEALGYLLGLPDWERGTGTRNGREELLLARPSALLEALGAPQARFRSVLVAGTKGKGSTAAMLASILQAAGLTVGFYSSPHLHTYRERIRVNGVMISEQDFASGVERIKPTVARMMGSHPEFGMFSTFEVMTALALEYFAEKKVDVAILEVGLGGRLDATNVVDAELSLITPISLDHVAVLGSTLQKIAAEKAGIIKKGKIVLSAPQHPETLRVIERMAREQSAVLGVGERDWIWLGGHTDFMVAGMPHTGLWKNYWHYGDLPVPLLGPHQFVNAALAVAAAHTIWANWGLGIGDWKLESGEPEDRRPEAREQVIRAGLKNVSWEGRLEVLQERYAEEPLIVTDGAHNGDSAEKLFEALEFHFEFDKLFLIIGVLGDKELTAIAKPFVGKTEFAWAVKPKHPRGRTAESVAWALNGLGVRASAANNLGEALALARGRAGAGDLILITGSLSMAAQARETFGLVSDKDPQGV